MHTKFLNYIAISLALLVFTSSNAFAQLTDEMGLTQIEQNTERLRLRKNCRAHSKTLVPRLSSTQFMKNSQSQNEAYMDKRKRVFTTCLKLSNIKKSYSPDLVTLRNSLPNDFPPQAQITQADGQPKTGQPKTALTIKVKPEGARIRILNINPVYKDKIPVKPGLYRIRVEKDGFKRWDKWLKVKGQRFVYTVKLVANKPSAKDKETSTGEVSITSAKASAPSSTFQYAPRRKIKTSIPDPNNLAKHSQEAAIARAKRAAFIKAQVAAKQRVEEQRQKKTAQISPASLQTGSKMIQETESPSSKVDDEEDSRFQEQVLKNKAKIARGQRILSAQKALKQQFNKP